jgi:hypothetical protein
MNWNLVFIVGLGGLAVVVVALLLRKQPVNYSFGDVGSRLFLPIGSTVGESKTEAENKMSIGDYLNQPVDYNCNTDECLFRRQFQESKIPSNFP